MPDRERIQELHDAGWTQAAIANEVGLSRSRVGQLIRQARTRRILAEMAARKNE